MDTSSSLNDARKIIKQDMRGQKRSSISCAINLAPISPVKEKALYMVPNKILRHYRAVVNWQLLYQIYARRKISLKEIFLREKYGDRDTVLPKMDVGEKREKTGGIILCSTYRKCVSQRRSFSRFAFFFCVFISTLLPVGQTF
jgi:hypothetical protein